MPVLSKSGCNAGRRATGNKSGKGGFQAVVARGRDPRRRLRPRSPATSSPAGPTRLDPDQSLVPAEGRRRQVPHEGGPAVSKRELGGVRPFWRSWIGQGTPKGLAGRPGAPSGWRSAPAEAGAGRAGRPRAGPCDGGLLPTAAAGTSRGWRSTSNRTDAGEDLARRPSSSGSGPARVAVVVRYLQCQRRPSASPSCRPGRISTWQGRPGQQLQSNEHVFAKLADAADEPVRPLHGWANTFRPGVPRPGSASCRRRRRPGAVSSPIPCRTSARKLVDRLPGERPEFRRLLGA